MYRDNTTFIKSGNYQADIVSYVTFVCLLVAEILFARHAMACFSISCCCIVVVCHADIINVCRGYAMVVVYKGHAKRMISVYDLVT